MCGSISLKNTRPFLNAVELVHFSSRMYKHDGRRPRNAILLRVVNQNEAGLHGSLHRGFPYINDARKKARTL